MSVAEILHQIEALPSKDRWQVLEHTRHLLEPEIPSEFTEAMAEIKRGEVVDRFPAALLSPALSR